MNQIGKHVLVDYAAGTFGDFLRYLISLHDGFERFKDTGFITTLESEKKFREEDYDDEADKKLMSFCEKENHVFTKVQCQPNKRIDFIKVNTIDKFNSEFDRLMPNNKDYRQAYKIMSIINDGTGPAHSCVGVTWLTEGAVINGTPFKWNYDDYNVVRQTDHKIIFISLSPFSKYRDIYLERHRIWDDFYGRDHNDKLHLESWTKNYMNDDYYPKHKLNYVFEINELLDKNEDAYLDLINFINVKPIDNWKAYVDEFNGLLFSK